MEYTLDLAKGAMEKSIQHWERLLSHTLKRENDEITSEGWSGSSCPACRVYHKNGECGGCPISTFTKQNDCEGTPWNDAHTAILRALKDSDLDMRWANAEHDINAELIFLRRVYKELLDPTGLYWSLHPNARSEVLDPNE